MCLLGTYDKPWMRQKALHEGAELESAFAYHFIQYLPLTKWTALCLLVEGYPEMQGTVLTLSIFFPQTFIEKLLYDRHSARLEKLANEKYKLTAQREIYVYKVEMNIIQYDKKYSKAWTSAVGDLWIEYFTLPRLDEVLLYLDNSRRLCILKLWNWYYTNAEIRSLISLYILEYTIQY